jgi:DNA-binding MarR family transcriptional regulator
MRPSLRARAARWSEAQTVVEEISALRWDRSPQDLPQLLQKLGEEARLWVGLLEQVAEQAAQAGQAGGEAAPMPAQAEEEGSPGKGAPPGRPAASAGTGARPRAEVLRTIVEMRRLRARHLGEDLFSDPAWDMLLDLMTARIEGKPVPISNLCLAAEVPTTTALRWINDLCRRGLIVRTADRHDRRRVLVALTPETERRMRAYLDAVAAVLDPRH